MRIGWGGIYVVDGIRVSTRKGGRRGMGGSRADGADRAEIVEGGGEGNEWPSDPIQDTKRSLKLQIINQNTCSGGPRRTASSNSDTPAKALGPPPAIKCARIMVAGPTCVVAEAAGVVAERCRENSGPGPRAPAGGGGCAAARSITDSAVRAVIRWVFPANRILTRLPSVSSPIRATSRAAACRHVQRYCFQTRTAVITGPRKHKRI